MMKNMGMECFFLKNICRFQSKKRIFAPCSSEHRLLFAQSLLELGPRNVKSIFKSHEACAQSAGFP